MMTTTQSSAMPAPETKPVRVPVRLKQIVKAFANVHRQGDLPNIFLFATARGGSTWVMELIASQPGMKYYDEPFNIRRQNVARTRLFPTWDTVMPDGADTERIVAYLRDLQRGRYGYMNPPPFRRNHRFFTSRIVFKIHELEHLVDTLPQRCNGVAVYLLRHPVPTSLSRAVLPRLDLFLRSEYYEARLGAARSRAIRALAARGTHLQRGVVSWCYENVVPLTSASPSTLFVTYEELVLNPVRSCDLLTARLQLTDRDAVLRGFGRPSANITMSSAETLAAMGHPDEQQRRRQLVTRWQPKLAPADVVATAEILDLFGLDVYRADGALPARRFLHFSDTGQLLGDAVASPS
jgi:hypothetical protein